ncbi:hypothetical protein SNEBB_004165 [Seison nebaliae]|nr:hypothetical protein SNEBB_004165 [Seison nebaliae]
MSREDDDDLSVSRITSEFERKRDTLCSALELFEKNEVLKAKKLLDDQKYRSHEFPGAWYLYGRIFHKLNQMEQSTKAFHFALGYDRFLAGKLIKLSSDETAKKMYEELYGSEDVKTNKRMNVDLTTEKEKGTLEKFKKMSSGKDLVEILNQLCRTFNGTYDVLLEVDANFNLTLLDQLNEEDLLSLWLFKFNLECQAAFSYLTSKKNDEIFEDILKRLLETMKKFENKSFKKLFNKYSNNLQMEMEKILFFLIIIYAEKSYGQHLTLLITLLFCTKKFEFIGENSSSPHFQESFMIFGNLSKTTEMFLRLYVERSGKEKIFSKWQNQFENLKIKNDWHFSFTEQHWKSFKKPLELPSLLKYLKINEIDDDELKDELNNLFVNLNVKDLFEFYRSNLEMILVCSSTCFQFDQNIIPPNGLMRLYESVGNRSLSFEFILYHSIDIFMKMKCEEFKSFRDLLNSFTVVELEVKQNWNNLLAGRLIENEDISKNNSIWLNVIMGNSFRILLDQLSDLKLIRGMRFSGEISQKKLRDHLTNVHSFSDMIDMERRYWKKCLQLISSSSIAIPQDFIETKTFWKDTAICNLNVLENFEYFFYLNLNEKDLSIDTISKSALVMSKLEGGKATIDAMMIRLHFDEGNFRELLRNLLKMLWSIESKYENARYFPRSYYIELFDFIYSLHQFDNNKRNHKRNQKTELLDEKKEDGITNGMYDELKKEFNSVYKNLENKLSLMEKRFDQMQIDVRKTVQTVSKETDNERLFVKEFDKIGQCLTGTNSLLNQLMIQNQRMRDDQLSANHLFKNPDIPQTQPSTLLMSQPPPPSTTTINPPTFNQSQQNVQQPIGVPGGPGVPHTTHQLPPNFINQSNMFSSPLRALASGMHPEVFISNLLKTARDSIQKFGVDPKSAAGDKLVLQAVNSYLASMNNQQLPNNMQIHDPLTMTNKNQTPKYPSNSSGNRGRDSVQGSLSGQPNINRRPSDEYGGMSVGNNNNSRSKQEPSEDDNNRTSSSSKWPFRMNEVPEAITEHQTLNDPKLFSIETKFNIMEKSNTLTKKPEMVPVQSKTFPGEDFEKIPETQQLHDEADEDDLSDDCVISDDEYGDTDDENDSDAVLFQSPCTAWCVQMKQNRRLTEENFKNILGVHVIGGLMFLLDTANDKYRLVLAHSSTNDEFEYPINLETKVKELSEQDLLVDTPISSITLRIKFDTIEDLQLLLQEFYDSKKVGKNDSLKFLMKNDEWSCGTCLTSVPNNSELCLACGQMKPGVELKKEEEKETKPPPPSFSFGKKLDESQEKPKIDFTSIFGQKTPIDLTKKEEKKEINIIKPNPSSQPPSETFSDLLKKKNMFDKFSFNLKSDEKKNEEKIENVVKVEEMDERTNMVVPVVEKLHSAFENTTKLKSGEENEIPVYRQRCKLYRYRDGQWKERGVGWIKISCNSAFMKEADKEKPDVSTVRPRVVMRRNETLKVCLNHKIGKDNILEKDNRSKNTWKWNALDYSDVDLLEEGEEIGISSLAAKFKTEESACKFNEILQIMKEKDPHKIFEILEEPYDNYEETMEEMYQEKKMEEKPNETKETKEDVKNSEKFELFKIKQENQIDGGNISLKEEKNNEMEIEELKNNNNNKNDKNNHVDTNYRNVLSDISNISQSDLLFKHIIGDGKDEDEKEEIEKSEPKIIDASDLLANSFFSQKTENIFDEKEDNSCDEKEDNLFEGKEGNLFDGKGTSLFGGKVANLFGGKDGNLFDAKETNLFHGKDSNLFHGKDSNLFDGKESSSEKNDDTLEKKNFFNCTNTEDTQNFLNIVSNNVPSWLNKETTKPIVFPSTGILTNTKTDDRKVSDDSFADQIDFAPALDKLPNLIHLRTGDEFENTEFVHRAKIYRFDQDQWKEKGVGNLKVLRSPETGKCRLLLIREQVFKTALNDWIRQDMKYARMKKSFTWTGFDDGEQMTFCLKILNSNASEAFIETVEKLQEMMRDKDVKLKEVEPLKLSNFVEQKISYKLETSQGDEHIGYTELCVFNLDTQNPCVKIIDANKEIISNNKLTDVTIKLLPKTGKDLQRLMLTTNDGNKFIFYHDVPNIFGKILNLWGKIEK